MINDHHPWATLTDQVKIKIIQPLKYLYNHTRHLPPKQKMIKTQNLPIFQCHSQCLETSDVSGQLEYPETITLSCGDNISSETILVFAE